MSQETQVNQPQEKTEDKSNIIKAVEDEPKEVKKENLENLSNEIRVNSRSSISSLLSLLPFSSLPVINRLMISPVAVIDGIQTAKESPEPVIKFVPSTCCCASP